MSRKNGKSVETLLGASNPPLKFEKPKLKPIMEVEESEITISHKPEITTKKRETKLVEAKAETKSEAKGEAKKEVKPDGKADGKVETKVEAKLSPLRTRLKQRNSVPKQEAIFIETKAGAKPEKKVKIQKSPNDKKKKDPKPVVYKSPTWMTSPRVKLIRPEKLVFKELLLRDPRYTEMEVDKIVKDHSS